MARRPSPRASPSRRSPSPPSAASRYIRGVAVAHDHECRRTPGCTPPRPRWARTARITCGTTPRYDSLWKCGRRGGGGKHPSLLGDRAPQSRPVDHRDPLRQGALLDAHDLSTTFGPQDALTVGSLAISGRAGRSYRLPGPVDERVGASVLLSVAEALASEPRQQARDALADGRLPCCLSSRDGPVSAFPRFSRIAVLVGLLALWGAPGLRWKTSVSRLCEHTVAPLRSGVLSLAGRAASPRASPRHAQADITRNASSRGRMPREECVPGRRAKLGRGRHV